MKTIGLLGGMSWESTLLYYRLVNEGVKARLGGLHSAKVRLASVDFHEIEQCQRTGNWDEAARLLAREAAQLEAAGAEALLICANTMHKVAPQVAAALTIPLLHVAEITGAAVHRAGCRRPILLGTRFTMAEPFYRERLVAGNELDVRLPAADEQAGLHRIIYEELCLGRIEPASRDYYRGVIARLVAEGADSVIFGCTEIGLLLSAADSPVPVFDTTVLHAAAAVDWALGATPA